MTQVHDQDALSARFGAVYTGALVDVLDELGLKNQALPHDLAPLEPGSHFAGPAYAIEGRGHPNMDHEESMVGILRMLSAVTTGHIAVYQTHDTTCSHLGELSVAALKVRGCRGAVIDGGCRDVGHILEQEFPVFCRYTTPIDAVGRWEVLEHGHTIFVGGVGITTGDYVAADRDGVVVVPREVSREVLERAEDVARTENLVRDAVIGGMAPLDAYQAHGRF